MKLFLVACIIVSLGVLGFASYKLLNFYTSFKYEVEEPIAMGKDSNAVSIKTINLETQIPWLWFIIGIEVVHIIIFLFLYKRYNV